MSHVPHLTLSFAPNSIRAPVLLLLSRLRLKMHLQDCCLFAVNSVDLWLVAFWLSLFAVESRPFDSTKTLLVQTTFTTAHFRSTCWFGPKRRPPWTTSFGDLRQTWHHFSDKASLSGNFCRLQIHDHFVFLPFYPHYRKKEPDLWQNYFCCPLLLRWCIIHLPCFARDLCFASQEVFLDYFLPVPLYSSFRRRRYCPAQIFCNSYQPAFSSLSPWTRQLFKFQALWLHWAEQLFNRIPVYLLIHFLEQPNGL